MALVVLKWAEYAVASRKLNQRLINLCTLKTTTLYPVVLQYIRTTQIVATAACEHVLFKEYDITDPSSPDQTLAGVALPILRS